MGSRKTAKEKRERPMRAASKRIAKRMGSRKMTLRVASKRMGSRKTEKEKREMTLRAASKRIAKRMGSRKERSRLQVEDVVAMKRTRITLVIGDPRGREYLHQYWTFE
jgi:hypothetical protein